MCINIWQKFHLLRLFSIGLMHEASVLKTFEWKLQKRAEREKDCRKAQAVGRTAGKPEDWSLGKGWGFGRKAGGRPTKQQDCVHMQHGSFTPNPPGPDRPFPGHLPPLFPLFLPQKADRSEGKGWSELGTGEGNSPVVLLSPQVPAGES